MKKVCVMGAGVMGTDIGQCFAMNGYQVIMRDIAQQFCDNSINRMKSSLDKMVSKGKMDQAEADKIMSNVSTTVDLAPLADCDLIVEAILENVQIKKDTFAELDKICKPETIFASNTSSISITEIASATKRTDKFIGMHFFNPATVMKLVEVIRGFGTSDETFNIIKDLSVAIGKTPVEVQEGPGFVVNRVLIPMINEAITILEDGIASAADIDTAMKLGANHPMGPLALGDLIGLDVCLNIMNVMYSETGDSKYRPAYLMKKMVRAGKLGRKTGEGFFSYK
ncbi:MAG: 3-hydroxybutyryl-CoA dehydrogenase [Firmicutes bacterium]|nr:3-hydroxybutyryl-CoA dehydrogenase [Bacillota bacterium]